MRLVRTGQRNANIQKATTLRSKYNPYDLVKSSRRIFTHSRDQKNVRRWAFCDLKIDISAITDCNETWYALHTSIIILYKFFGLLRRKKRLLPFAHLTLFDCHETWYAFSNHLFIFTKFKNAIS